MTTPNLPGDPPPESAVRLAGIIAGRYEIQRQIGEGGMATVYLARDLNRDTLVALKAPRPELVLQLGGERFLREIQITTTLQHPHIVPVLDAGSDNGVPFYIMPYIQGETLEQRLKRTGPLPVQEAIALAGDVLDGLMYAHRLGFVHRDVKPSNVMLSNGHAQLADFGIAKAVERTDNRKLTESGFALGTAEYMSPEQAAGEAHLDGRSDLYSLGCVMYEMCVGAPPFTAPTARGVMARHFVDPVPSIRTVRDTVPVKLEAAIFTALAKTPVDRFADAEAFRAALKDPTLHDAVAVTAGPAAVRRARTWKAAVIAGTMVAGFSAFTVWRTAASPGGSLDATRVMVYPFVAAEGLGGARSMGEDVATIIGNALDAAEPLRWIDGWSVMDEASRADIRSFTHDKARRLARTRRCATFVEGRLTRHGADSVSVTLSLWDARADTLLSTESATGAAADPWRQGLRAVSRILPKLITGSDPRFEAEWKDRRPGAVANFLLGEAAYRRARMPDALAHFRKAVGLDSTFALAALRGAQAASWAHRSTEAASMVRLALAQPLPPRYRNFALGVSAYIDGWADSAATYLSSAIAADSEMTVAWMQLGETYVHLLPLRGNPDSLAERAFAMAQQRDSTSAAILFHPLQHRLVTGDTAGATPLMARFLAAQPDSELLGSLLIVDACVRRGPAGVNWTERARRQPLATLAAGRDLLASARPGCAKAAFDAILAVDTGSTPEADPRRFAALIGVQALALQRNAPDAASSAIDAFVTRWGAGKSIYLLVAPYAPALLPRAEAIAQEDEAQYGAAYAQYPYPRRLWELGALELARGRPDIAARIATALLTRAFPEDSAYARVRGASLTALVQLARGDTSGAESALRSLLARSAPASELQWEELAPLGAERLALSRLLLARKAYAEAIDVASVFDSRASLIFALYLPASLELRAAAAKSLGNSISESHYRNRLAALRNPPQGTGS
ncbi:MAG: protein kinase [Gemmatimonadaceae bacterium]|nr:protein kinase [Gemmatimonadaceae bacterium]